MGQHGWRWVFGWGLAIAAGDGVAQVVMDGTLGRAGSLAGPNYAITADLGQQRGGNLFHSFGQFTIPTGESAIFSGPNSVGNIIGRVTGGQRSTIDGALRSTIPGANLYLLNPAGLLFGENASLDVSGSVHFSTADTLKLGDGGRFDARTPGNIGFLNELWSHPAEKSPLTPLWQRGEAALAAGGFFPFPQLQPDRYSVLTVVPVEAFGFIGPAPGKIEINGTFLRVPEGQTLSLIGGEINLTNATVYAPAGRLNVATVGSAGEVIPKASDLELRGFGYWFNPIILQLTDF